MGKELKLNPDEVVLHQGTGVSRGKVTFGVSKRNDLILTNQAILFVKKNLFGKAVEVTRFPLSDLRVVNGKVQAVPGKLDIVTPSLDLYFQSGVERFGFDFESDVKEWIRKITSAVTGEEIPEEDPFAWVQSTAAMAETAAAAVNKVKDAFGIKSKEEVAVKCPSCGASLKGIRGETAQCPYCESYVKF